MEFQDAVAVVTGGTGSMGSQICAHLAERGAVPVRWDLGDYAEPDVRCNVSDDASVRAAFATTVERYGVPSILVNTAGVSGGRAPWAADASDEDWQFVLSSAESWQTAFDVHVHGVVNTSREFARLAKKNGTGGAIINITSISGGTGFNDPAMAALSASKAACNSLTRTAAKDFGPLGIRVNAIAPGVMETRVKVPGVSAQASSGQSDPQERVERVKSYTPYQNRLVRVTDVADGVIALLSADFVTGEILLVDGGLSLRSVTKPC